MYILFLCLCISLEWIHFKRGQATTGTFTNGNFNFTWDYDFDKDLVQNEAVNVGLDGHYKNWTYISTFGNFMQMDILKYKTVSFQVATYIDDYLVVSNITKFKVPNVIIAESGKDKEIEIPLDSIPLSGKYVIKNYDKNIVLFTVGKTVSSADPSKYIIVQNDYKKTTSITINIKNATTEDAGYIATGADSNPKEPGVVLVVTGSPTKPIITGNVDVPVGENVSLTCDSKSTPSAPFYYKMLPPMTYIWYRNESEITGLSSNQWTFKVEKRYKYDVITCISKEEFNSTVSEPFRVKPQYGPDELKISPEIQKTVDVIEGESFGPYTCSADCNPPCTYKWKIYESGNRYENLVIGPTLTISQVDKTHANRYRCRVESDYKNYVGSTTVTKTVTLRVLYLSKPVVYTDNSIQKISEFEEKDQINLSCKVEGVPQSQVSIHKDRNTLSTGYVWSNYSFSKGLQCEDTGNYTCTGKSSRFDPTEKTFLINVLCSTRLDVANSPRSTYGSQIGQISRVIIPVISNPKPFNLTWKKPANADIQTNITQGSVLYKYMIESNIYIKEQSDFGNYTAMVGDRELTVITVKALLPPYNVDGLGISNTAILLTWEANDESAPVKRYLIYQFFKESWKIIANESGENNKKQFSYVVNQRLSPDRSYDFGIKSCNADICSTLQKVLGIHTLGNLETSSNATSAVGISFGVALVVVLIICLLISIALLKKYRSKRASEMGNRQEEHVSVTEDEDHIENQRLPVENLTDSHVYDTLDEGINCQNNQTESSVIPKKDQYQDVLGIIKADGRDQEIIQMAQYQKDGGYVGKMSKSGTGEHIYENTRHNDDKSGRLFTAMSRNDEPKSSLDDDLPRSSMYTSLCPNEEQGSLYTSLPKNI